MLNAIARRSLTRQLPLMQRAYALGLHAGAAQSGVFIGLAAQAAVRMGACESPPPTQAKDDPLARSYSRVGSMQQLPALELTFSTSLPE